MLLLFDGMIYNFMRVQVDESRIEPRALKAAAAEYTQQQGSPICPFLPILSNPNPNPNPNRR